MSNRVFTPPLGLTWPVKKTLRYSTTVKSPPAGKGQTRWANAIYPIWQLDFEFAYLKGGEQVAESGLQQLFGFYMQSLGRWDDWLYEDPNDHTIPALHPRSFGLGDGVTTAFQLTRSIGAGTDIVQNVNPLKPPIIRLDYSLHRDLEAVGVNYTLSPTGIVQWTGPPAPGMVMTWTGSYFYRFHFLDDTLSLDNLMHELWDDGGTTIKAESIIL